MDLRGRGDRVGGGRGVLEDEEEQGLRFGRLVRGMKEREIGRARRQKRDWQDEGGRWER